MDPHVKMLNYELGLQMVRRMDGRCPIMLFGYEPATGEWRLLTHPEMVPVLQNPTSAEAFKKQVMQILDEAAHPENLKRIQANDPQPQPADIEALERMLGEEEGGES